MKENFKGISLADLCSWFGVSRQAYYQSKNGVEQDLIEQEILLEKINDIRKDHKRLGGRKLFFNLAVSLLSMMQKTIKQRYGRSGEQSPHKNSIASALVSLFS